MTLKRRKELKKSLLRNSKRSIDAFYASMLAQGYLTLSPGESYLDPVGGRIFPVIRSEGPNQQEAHSTACLTSNCTPAPTPQPSASSRQALREEASSSSRYSGLSPVQGPSDVC